MNFDSDLSSARAPYAGRHRKTPAYLRAASNLRLPHLTRPPLPATARKRSFPERPLLSTARKRPLPESPLADATWPATTQPAA